MPVTGVKIFSRGEVRRGFIIGDTNLKETYYIPCYASTNRNGVLGSSYPVPMPRKGVLVGTGVCTQSCVLIGTGAYGTSSTCRQGETNYFGTSLLHLLLCIRYQKFSNKHFCFEEKLLLPLSPDRRYLNTLMYTFQG